MYCTVDVTPQDAKQKIQANSMIDKLYMMAGLSFEGKTFEKPWENALYLSSCKLCFNIAYWISTGKSTMLTLSDLNELQHKYFI